MEPYQLPSSGDLYHRRVHLGPRPDCSIIGRGFMSLIPVEIANSLSGIRPELFMPLSLLVRRSLGTVLKEYIP